MNAPLLRETSARACWKGLPNNLTGPNRDRGLREIQKGLRILRIGFDISQTGKGKAGCGYFADSLVRHLSEIDAENQYILYPTFGDLFWDPDWSSGTCRIQRPNFKCGSGHKTFEAARFFWNDPLADIESHLANPDLIHANNFFPPTKLQKARLVYTLYDLSFLEHPEWSTEQNRTGCSNGVFNASLYADHCIAISEHTKKAFLHYFPHYPEDRITVVYLGTRETLNSNMDVDLKDKVLKKFNINKEFWLGVGTIEPRKNYRLLIEAYAELKDEKRLLVIAGGKGWFESDLGGMVKEYGIKDYVKFLGYVSDEELSALYSSCFAFIYPSFYEGFGLPVLEAMSCDAPVITSNTSSLPEVGGDAVLYINPRSKENLIEKMKLLMDHPLLIQELRKKSKERSKIFSWNKAAEIVLKIYQETMQTKSWFIE